MDIYETKLKDSIRYQQHLERIIDNASHDEVIFSPREKGEYKPTELEKKAIEERWEKPIGNPGWERCFHIEEAGLIRGHILLRAKKVRSGLHRVDLQMGLEAMLRGRGMGTKLLEWALHWARTNTHVEWIDLGVFESNAIAVKLYEKFGFKIVGRVEDSFRVYGQPMTDLAMTLRISR